MFGLGLGEILVICLFLLIFIGPKKLPELARGLGKGISEFKKASQDLKTEIMKDQNSQDSSVASSAIDETKKEEKDNSDKEAAHLS